MVTLLTSYITDILPGLRLIVLIDLAQFKILFPFKFTENGFNFPQANI